MRLFYFLIALVVLLVVGTSLLSLLRGEKKETREETRSSIQRKTTPVPKATLTLRVDPSAKSVKPGETFTVSILGNTNKELLATDLYLTYDPKGLNVSTMTPGDFFTDPITFSKKTDTVKGEVFYAVGSLKPSNREGTLLTITFQVRETSQDTVVVLSEKTIAAREKGEEVTVIIQNQGTYTIL